MRDPEKLEAETLEPALDVETSPMMEPSSILACEVPAAPPPNYWQAQDMAKALHKEFEALQKKRDIQGMRQRFYTLAHYYGRTLGILRQALRRGREPLITAALYNLVTLHQPLHHMHEIAPTSVPFAVTLNKETRNQLIGDLIIEVLQEAAGPLDLENITSRVNEMHLLADVKPSTVRSNIKDFIAKGHVQKEAEGYSRTKREYSFINLDKASLMALLGPKLYEEFEHGGFPGLSNIATRKDAFKRFFESFTGCSTIIADMFIAAANELLGPPSIAPDLTPWRHEDLIGSIYPRPYQHDAYAIFRGHGYQGQVIEAPTGSGKTMIGMMCIQDWLRGMSTGEAILILVPTVNYEQQWVGELCYKPIGLRITPDYVFTGTPAALEFAKKRSGFSPAILVMTYTALAQLGSPTGKGGFDRISIEKFLQGSKIQYVILDEVHKLVEDLRSVSADVTRLLTEWLRDGSIRGVIGFSGTAAAFRQRFTDLGLQLVYILPAADLIAYGFVAPFSEFGVPFAFSDREKRVRDLIEEYKSNIHEFIDLVGSQQLREWFISMPLEKRLAAARDFLGLYETRKDQDEALTKRFHEWESGNGMKLTELPLLTILQVANNWSDQKLVEEAIQTLSVKEQERRQRRFQAILRNIKEIKQELKELIYFPDILHRLKAKSFGIKSPLEDLRQLQKKSISKSMFAEGVKDSLAMTIVGLYGSLKNFYLRIGEGRVDSIKSIMAAENTARKINGVIVFDRGKRIRWDTDEAVPGYSGVAGVFAQMLGEKKITPMAVLSSEIYMPWKEKNPLPLRIAGFIKQEIMLEELGEALFGLLTQGLGLTEDQTSSLHSSFREILRHYIQGLSKIRASRPGEFNRKVLRSFRREIKKVKLDSIETKILARISMKNFHLRRWIKTFFDYGLIASYFIIARVAELRQVSGELQKFYVVKMAQGERKQFMYDLTARVTDAETLPVNVIIVSPWARTGWNVIRPNVLIDATATRNVTAWQQLRGRAMRAMKTWDKECYSLVMQLLGSHVSSEEKSRTNKLDQSQMEEVQYKTKAVRVLDDSSRRLLLEVHDLALKSKGLSKAKDSDRDKILSDKIKKGRISKFTAEEKARLTAELMEAQNKVTHIYELVKAYGSAPQVRLDRSEGKWLRKESIAIKHSHEYSVSPVSGRYGPGERHAPLVYSKDPRKNLPSQLRRQLVQQLKGVDRLVVNGWIRAVVSGMKEDLGLE